jgi:peptidoglycan/LPS O-acetylase OafA/YrhL
MDTSLLTRQRSDGALAVSDAVPRTLLAGDGLRAIAALSVVALHAAIETMLFRHSPGFFPNDQRYATFHAIVGPLTFLLNLTRAGIYVFFALSGYLLSRGFLAAYTLGTPLPAIGRYARNRVLRIVPAFWVVSAVFLTWDHNWRSGGLGGIAAVFGFAQNYHHTAAAGSIAQAWTLDLEVCFYALIPIVALIAMVAIRRRPSTPAARLRLVLGVMLIGYAVSLFLKHLAGEPTNNEYTIAEFLFAFIPGTALAAIEPFAAPLARERKATRWAWASLIAAIALMAAYVALPASLRNLKLIAETLGCGALLAAPLILQWSTGGCWRVLDNRVMHWLGERSYGIYLIHLGLMGHLLQRIGHGRTAPLTFVLLLLSSTVVTVIAADLLWRLVEHPVLQRRLPWRQAEFARAGA